MRTVFTLLVIMAAAQVAFACGGSIGQSNWRWRNNDGSEATATWKAAQQTPVTYNSQQGMIRLRIEVTNTIKRDNGLAITNNCVTIGVGDHDSLQYSTNTADPSSWKNIGIDPKKAFVLFGNSTFFNQNDTTTPQISGSSYSFNPGRMMVSDSVAQGFGIPPVKRTEIEWGIKGTDSMQTNTVYYFRQYGRFSYGFYYSYNYTYLTYPYLTTTAPLPIQLTRFLVAGEGSKAHLEWATATEQNNDRFEVQQSTDQRTWQTIATIKGKGNSATPVEYFADDDKPLPGINYYRLQQFDKDGKSTFSEVRSFKLTGSGATVSVWPNPVKNIIQFNLGNTGAAKLNAVLSDASGKIIYRQIFSNVQANAVNTVMLPQKPAPGVYLLQLKGNDLSESMKIIVQ